MKKQFLFILLILCSLAAPAQNRLSSHNNIVWLNGTITPRLSKKFSGHIEYHFRRADWISSWQQSLLRLGLNYQLHKQATAHIGYGWILTYPYGEPTLAAIPKTYPEHRIYEQLTIRSSVGKVALQQRIRLEQRWVGRYTSSASDAPDTWTYLNRVRYMTRAELPLRKKLYAATYDELFIGFGKNVGENVLDQNRFCLLLGRNCSKALRLEAGYLNQTVQLGREISGKNLYQYNNGIIISAFWQIN